MTYQALRTDMLARLNEELTKHCDGFTIFRITERKTGLDIGVAYDRENSGKESLLKAMEAVGLRAKGPVRIAYEIPYAIDTATFPAEVVK